MNADEKNVLIATAGMVITAIGAFLPWARIGGRNRSGLNTADTFIGLANGVLPDAIAWVGRWWYLPAGLAFIAWGSTFVRGHWATRSAGVAVVLIGLVMWWVFVWAGTNYNVFTVKPIGPIVCTIGMLILAFACSQRRGSMLRPGPNPT